MARSFVLLAAQPGVGVGDLDGQLSCPLHNQLPVLGRDIVGDLGTVCPAQQTHKSDVWVYNNCIGGSSFILRLILLTPLARNSAFTDNVKLILNR